MIRRISFNIKSDSRGELLPIELGTELPFKIQRIYFVRNVPSDLRRGYHAHRELEQVALCLKGSCTLLLDNGKDKENVVLQDDGQGLYIGPMVWHEMFDFTKDCVLAVLASAPYSESDYIRNYEEFAQIKAGPSV